MRAFDSAAYVGLPYAAGGRTPTGIDCWGLARLVYQREFGIDLPGHDEANTEDCDGQALEDYIAAHAEGWECVTTPEPGDLVRLRVDGAEMHIGIMLAGGQFLHARQGHDSVVERVTSVRWSHRIAGYYRYAPRSTAITLAGCPHPLRLARVTGEVVAGTILHDAIMAHCAEVRPELVRNGVAFVNGLRVPFIDWPLVVLSDGDRVEFRIFPSGGDNQALRTVLMVVVAVAAAWVGGWVGGAVSKGGLGMSAGWAAVASVGVTVVGTAAVNAIAPIRTPEQDAQDTTKQYTLAGGANTAQQYAAIPVVLGEHDFTPPLGAKSYLSSDGTNRYLHLLLIWGYGPLDVDDMRIGSTPLADFEDVEVYHLSGETYEYDADGNLDWAVPSVSRLLNVYGSDIEQQLPEVELTETFVTRATTQSNVQRLSVLLSFPGGLIRVSNGVNTAISVNVALEYRRLGYYDATDTWVPVTDDWHDSWARIPGLRNFCWAPSYEHVRMLVVLRNGTQLALRALQGFMGSVPMWPTAKTNEVALYQIEDATLVATLNTEFTGFAVTFNYEDFAWWVNVAAGSMPRYHTFQNASSRPFDHTLTMDFAVEPGQYEIRLRRNNAAAITPMISDRVYWLALTEERQNIRPIAPPAPLTMTGIRIRATNQVNGSLDGVLATVRSRQLIWNGAAWVVPGPTDARNNPASLYRHVLQHPANAKAVADSGIDLVQLAHWSEFCDEHGFIYENVIAGSARPVREVLADIAAAGRASIAQPDGIWSVCIDEPKTDIVQHFTPHNSWGFAGNRVMPQLPHALRVGFMNREKQYQPDEYIVYNDGYSAANATLFESIELPGVTDAGTAAAPGAVFKLGRFHMEQIKLRPEEYELHAEIESIICTRGDRVKVAHDVPMWGLGSGRITGRTLDGSGHVTAITTDEPLQMESAQTYTLRWRTKDNASAAATLVTVAGYRTSFTFLAPVTADLPDVGDLFLFGLLNQESVDCLVKSVEPISKLQARLLLCDYAPAVFDAETAPFGDWESQITEPPPLMRTIIDQSPVIDSIVTDEFALTRNNSTLQPNILLRFRSDVGRRLVSGVETVETLSQYAADVELQYRLGSTIATNMPWNPLPTVSAKAGAIMFGPVVEQETYDLRLRFLGADGRSGPWLSVPGIYVVGRTTPPDAVTGFYVIKVGDMALASWDRHPADDVRYGGQIVIRHSPLETGATWASSVVVGQFDGNSTVGALPMASGTYLAKALDQVDLWSDSAASYVLTGGTVTTWTTVASSEQAPGFTGTKTDTEVSAGTLRLVATELVGSYEFDAVMDLTTVATRRFEVTIEAAGTDSSDTIGARGLVSLWPSVVGLAVAGDVVVSVATTNDDPGGSPTWSAWVPFTIGDFTCRAAKFKADLQVEVENYNISISTLGVVAKVPA